jgi:hypothetical protein
MISPTQKSLQTTFKLDAKQARLIKDLCTLRDSPEKLIALIHKECSETAAYTRRCGNYVTCSSRLRRTMFVLHAIDHILGTCGVESLGSTDNPGYAPDYEYCNAGDTYATTLIYKRETDRLFIGCWGDIAEQFSDVG